MQWIKELLQVKNNPGKNKLINKLMEHTLNGRGFAKCWESLIELALYKC